MKMLFFKKLIDSVDTCFIIYQNILKTQARLILFLIFLTWQMKFRIYINKNTIKK